MDKEETFVKMCEKAEEIQGLAKRGNDWQAHDYFYYPGYKGGWNNSFYVPSEIVVIGDAVECSEGLAEYLDKLDTAIWLPRQDQLQAMLSDNINQVVRQVGITSCLHFKNLTEMMTMSWEQLWLALVMLILYQKRWDGENWTKEGK